MVRQISWAVEKKTTISARLVQPASRGQEEADHCIDGQREGDDDAQHAQEPRQPQGGGRKAGQPVDRQPHHLGQGVAGLAGVPALAVVKDLGLPAAEPGDHAAQEAVLFGHGVQPFDDAPGHQPEVTGVARDLDLGDGAEQAIEQVAVASLKRLSCPRPAAAVDDVHALVHSPHHLAEQFGRVLQVGVDDQHALAARQAQARRDRELVTVVARQVDADDVGARPRPDSISLQVPSREPSLTRMSSKSSPHASRAATSMRSTKTSRVASSL